MATSLSEPLQDALLDIAAIAASSLGVQARLEDIDSRLGQELPFVALNQTVLTRDCKLRIRRSRGYSPRILGHLSSDVFRADLEAFGSLRPGRSLRMSDLPVHLQHSETVVDYILPEGFRDGITTPLCTPQGRLVGFQHMSFAEKGHLSDGVCRFLDRVSRIVAPLIDPATDQLLPQTLGWVTFDAQGHVADQGGALAMGLCDTDLALRAMRVAGPVESLWVVPHADGLRRIGLRAMPDAVRLSDLGPTVPPLTHRELEVAATLPLGLSNPQIAVALSISARTANAHVAAILEKLDVVTRAAAAARVVETGWRLL